MTQIVSFQVSAGTSSHQLIVRYFDRLQQTHLSAVITCENSNTSHHLDPALVNCRATNISVKLPLGAELLRVKALGRDTTDGKINTTISLTEMIVEMQTPKDMVRVFLKN